MQQFHWSLPLLSQWGQSLFEYNSEFRNYLVILKSYCIEYNLEIHGLENHKPYRYVVLIALVQYISSNNFLPWNTFLLWIVSKETIQFIRVKNWHFREICFSNINSCCKHYLQYMVFGCTHFILTLFPPGKDTV